MKSKILQILTLCGGFFIISSVLSMISYILQQICAVIFPIFLIIIVLLCIMSKLSRVTNFQIKYPNLTLLLNVMGGYVLIYFLLNIIVIPLLSDISDYMALIDGAISFGFIVSVFISLLIILVRTVKRK